MKVAIIGSGPAGLLAAIKCQENNIEYTLFEADDFLGGQLTHVYPEKEIVNIPGIEYIIAKDYIKSLVEKINLDNVKINTKITDIDALKNEYDYVIVAFNWRICS